MSQEFPQAFEVVRNWTWDNYAPHYQALQDTDLNADNLSTWIEQWSSLYRTVSEFFSRLNIATTLDTTDEKAREELQKAMSEIYPSLNKAHDSLNRKLLTSGLEPEGLDVIRQQIQAEMDIFSEDNLALDVESNKLSQDYMQIMGGQSVEWEGEETTLMQLKTQYKDTERSLREKAWRTVAERGLQDREAINNIWQKFMGIRKQTYENVDAADFRAYMWKARGRLSYSPDDAVAFCEAIEQVVVPAIERLREKRAKKLGVDVLRPWDGQLEPHDPEVDPEQLPALEPYHSKEDFIAKSEAVFEQVDAEMAEFFRVMRDEDLLDIDNRKGKAGGAYCSDLPVKKQAFLFMNAVNSSSDVSTMLHEAGHCFHTFYAAKQSYITDYHGIPMEFAEVASMAMELLASPYLSEEKGGYFSEEDTVRYRYDHLMRVLYMWPYMAVIVLFQHWAYTNHELATDPKECDKKWTELWHRFIKGVDYTGVEDWVATGWHRKGHIFFAPFYYIEYGMAQLGAVQVWANALKDQQAALEQYRAALKLGASVSLAELYETAGAKFGFDAETFQQSIDLIESTMSELEAQM